MNATEAGRLLGVSAPTAYHLLNTLVAAGVLAKDRRRRYLLGPRIGVLSDALARDLEAPDFLLGPLRELAAQTGETACLTAWRREQITVLACVEGAHAVRVAGLHSGFCEHAHARATGKLLLAFASPYLREDYLRRNPLVALTERTIIDRERFARELEGIRRRGFATEREEFAESVACLAVPVIEDGSVIAAFTLAAPRERFERRLDELTLSALRTARSVFEHREAAQSRAS
jgi:IclR family acetate operon transcriptional repressor